MIYRREYRAKLIGDLDKKSISQILTNDLVQAKEMKKVLTASLFENAGDLFLYFETEDENLIPESFLASISDLLYPCPSKEEEDNRLWCYMYPMFYHSIPNEMSGWMQDRHPDRVRGRIAYLYDDQVASYVYYHTGLVKEGLLKGDKYHFISLHENILFSYFEEPKTMVNLSGKDEESQFIQEYLQYGERKHFIHRNPEDENFYFINEVAHI